MIHILVEGRPCESEIGTRARHSDPRDTRTRAASQVSGVGHCRQVGCPESGVDAAVAALVQRGHKVGRIEQMETAAQVGAPGFSRVWDSEFGV